MTARSTKADGLKWRPYPAYEDSGVEWLGEIPAHWSGKRLKFLCRVNPAKGELAAMPEDTEVSFLPMEKIGESGALDLSEKQLLRDVQQGFTYFRDGDVIVAKITPCFENGKGALCVGLSNGVGFGTTELHVLRAGKATQASFLSWLTRTHQFRVLGTTSMSGVAGQQRVTEAFVRDFFVALPEPAEQRAIAAFLARETARIDALLAKKERLIVLLEEKRAALISHAVTKGLNPNAPMKDSSIEWLGRIPAHWALLPLRRVVRRFVDYRGATPTKVLAGVPLVTARNIKEGTIDFGLSEEFIPEADYGEWMVRGMPARGDVLVTTEAPLGECAQVVDTGIALAQRIILLKADKQKMSSDFLWVYFRSSVGIAELHSRATGSTALGIKASHLKEVLVPVPPTHEQANIVQLVNRCTEPVTEVALRTREQIEKLQEYRTALIAAAVTGKIDVREGA